MAKTKAPIQHTVTHELAHAKWNSAMRSPSALKASKDIDTLYAKWLRDTDAQTRWGQYAKKTYGRYAKIGGKDEFYAETMSRAIHSNGDSYTRRLIGIIKRNKL